MKIVDKRMAEGTVEIRKVECGTIVELDGGLRSSMKDEHRMVLVMDRRSVDVGGSHTDDIPVVTLAGHLGWLHKTVHVTPLEATIEVDHKKAD